MPPSCACRRARRWCIASISSALSSTIPGFGRIAANHALGDIFAMGAEAAVGDGHRHRAAGPGEQGRGDAVPDDVGAIEVLNEAGCALVGGHTGEGSELALGFAINGLIDEGWRA
jgi:selenide,water dikinase